MEQKSILDHITEHDVVTVHNPLSEVFVWPVATSVVARPNRQAVQTGNSGADSFISGLNAGIDQGGHISMQHTQYPVEITAGQTLKLPGDMAKVFVRHLVKALMQKDGKTRQMADPFTVMEYEKKIVLNHKSMLSNLSVETAEEKVKRQIAELNKSGSKEVEQENEQAFPTETDSVRKSAGRPRTKTD